MSLIKLKIIIIIIIIIIEKKFNMISKFLLIRLADTIRMLA